jgi:hypothetical protein
VQFLSINALYIRILILSIKPFLKTYNALLSTISSRLLIKKRNRIEDTSDFYRIPVFIFSISNSLSIIFIIIVRLVIKLYTHLKINSRTLRLQRL